MVKILVKIASVVVANGNSRIFVIEGHSTVYRESDKEWKQVKGCSIYLLRASVFLRASSYYGLDVPP